MGRTTPYLEPLAEKSKAFGWSCLEIDGHDGGDLSVLSRRVVEALLSIPERDRLLRALRAWVGFRQTGVAYRRAERFAGQSTNSFLDNIRWAKRGIFVFRKPRAG